MISDHRQTHRARRRACRGEFIRPYKIALSADGLRQALAAQGADPPAEFAYFASIDSTNAYLQRRAAEGAVAGTLCLADHQSAGRGRRGRRWISPAGANLYLSLLWRFDQPPDRLTGLSLAAGAVVAAALEQAGVVGIALKWPNDLLWERRKLGGLLLESTARGSAATTVVLGLGLNVRMPAPDGALIDQPWVDLREAAPSLAHDRQRLAALLAIALSAACRRYAEEGSAPFLPLWRRFDRYWGETLTLARGASEVTGIHRGIAPDGALLIETSEGIRPYHAGEVSLRRLVASG